LELHVFACSECQYEQKHVTSTPSPMGLSYSSVCEDCKVKRTFRFVREGKRKKDWYKNTLSQVKKKQEKERFDDSLDSMVTAIKKAAQ
jgi:hypothetical protein